MSNSESPKLEKRKRDEEEFDPDLSNGVHGIIDALLQKSVKSLRDSLKWDAKMISSPSSMIKSMQTELEKERQGVLKALSKISKDEETAKFQTAYEKFCNIKAQPLQKIYDAILKFENVKEKLLIHCKQRKREKTMLSEIEKPCASEIAKLEESLNKKRQEKIRELLNQVPEGEHDTVGPNDIFSQVMGKENPGSVRMYGLGVCPSDVWGTIPSSGTNYRMAMEWQIELEKTNNQLEELRALVMQGGTNEINRTNDHVISPNLHMGSSSLPCERRRIKVGDYVCLKSVVNPTEIVGKGRVNTMDSSAEVGGEELGLNWCEVQVQVPIKWDEHLIRPYGGLKTVGDAIGTPIAWPISLVMQDEDDDN